VRQVSLPHISQQAVANLPVQLQAILSLLQVMASVSLLLLVLLIVRDAQTRQQCVLCVKPDGILLEQFATQPVLLPFQ